MTMGDLSEISKGLVRRFNIVHFPDNIHKLSENNFKLKVRKYVSQFTTCLISQLSTETEVYISGGIVLPRSNHIFGRLCVSTKVLEYKCNLKRIYFERYIYINASRVVLLSETDFETIFSNAIDSLEHYIQLVQLTVIDAFHRKQNNFVCEKMKVVPKVLNLCKVQTPAALTNILSMGTKSVPNYQVSDYNYSVIIYQCLRDVINRCFLKIVGFWPFGNNISSINQYFIEILSQCPSNHLFVDFMYTIVTEYHKNVALCKFSLDPIVKHQIGSSPRPSIVPSYKP